MNEGGAKHLEYYSRSCEKELELSCSNVKCVTFDMMSRKIMLLFAPATWRVAGAAREVASEGQPDEASGVSRLAGRKSYSLFGIQKDLRNWEKKWRQVFINQKTKVINIRMLSRA